MLSNANIIFRFIFRNDFFAGLFFILLSYIPLITHHHPTPGLSSMIIGAAFPLGGLLMANYVTVKLGGFSLISRIRGSQRNNQSFTIVALTGGAILQFLIGDLAGIWYYPQWSYSSYILIGFVVGGWTFYFLFLITCYEAVKLLLDRVTRQGKKVTRYFKHENLIYNMALVLGVGIMLLIILQSFLNTDNYRDFKFVINQPHKPYINWIYAMLTFPGIVLVCEYVEYRRRRSSLIKDTIHGYINPLLAGIISSVVLAIAYENQNYGVYLWKYANYPWEHHHILNVPVFVVMTWPFHVIGLVVFWRAFGNASSSVVFANSKNFSKRKVSKQIRINKAMEPAAAYRK